jgi:hypothetical protein
MSSDYAPVNADFYERLLKAENKYDRLDGWWKAEILSPALDLRKYKRYFLEMLSDDDLDVVLHAWQLLPKLIKMGIVDRGEYNVEHFERALREGDVNAWWIGYDLYREGIIDLDVLRRNISYFEKALKADPMTRIGAWSLLPHLLDLGLLVRPSEEYVMELLDPRFNYHVRLNVAYLVMDLKEKGVIRAVDANKLRAVVEDPRFVTLSEAYEKDWRKLVAFLDGLARNA